MKTLFPTLLISFLSLGIVVHSHSAQQGDQATAMPLNLLENDKAGRIVDINHYRGKLVYMDFWASWCGPCRKSLPVLNEIRADYADRGFEVVAINVDQNLTDALRFLDKYPVDYPVLLDPEGRMPKAYHVKAMPTAFLIDERGKILHKHIGFEKKDRKKIEGLIRQHLAGR